MANPRYALMLVHGQGEQRSMEMGLRFVEHVVQANFDPNETSQAHSPQVRIVTENQDGIDSARRIEIRYNNGRPDIDAFEFYWAPLLTGNSLSHFVMWFCGMLRRKRDDIPKRARTLHLLSRIFIWLLFSVSAFYIYATILSVLPIQMVQIATHGWGIISKFSLDWRLIFSIILLYLMFSALILLLFRRYNWSLGFIFTSIMIAAFFPLAIDVESQIQEDIGWLYEMGEDPPPFNIWGSRLVGGKAAESGILQEAAAAMSRYLCGDRSDSVAMLSDRTLAAARQNININSKDATLQWTDMEPNRGVQLKDLCLAPITIANPVLFSRSADSAHILLTGIFSIFFVMFYVAWKSVLRNFLVNIMGDSARYLNNHPANNSQRQAIRQQGVQMLDALQKSQRYDRIIVIAHSLGSIVAYDVLRHYWGQVYSQCKIPKTLWSKVATAANALNDADGSAEALKKWQDAQGSVFEKLAGSWSVSDFVTLGSPLAHGRLLMEGCADSVPMPERFSSQRDITRSILACPPVDVASLSTTLGPADMFMAVKWTNLFFKDDIVGGTVAKDPDGLLFGAGVMDLPYSTKGLAVRGMSHNSYWLSRLAPSESDNVPWLKKLRTLLGIDA